MGLQRTWTSAIWVDGGCTIEWPSEADITPETLYDHVQLAVYEERKAGGT